jgi:hypothetical protein
MTEIKLCETPGFVKHNIANAGRRQQRAYKKYEALLEQAKTTGNAKDIASAFRLGIRYGVAYLKARP